MIPNINLLPKTEKRGSDSKLIYYILAILTLLVLAFFVLQYFNARSELTTLTAGETQLQNEVSQLQTEYNFLLARQGQGSLEESVTFVERVSYPVSPLIDETEGLLPDNTYLRSYSFSEAAVSISVDFETLASIAQYVDALENSPYFTDAQLSNVSNFELGVGASDDEDEREKFNEIPRYSTNITLEIDQAYLATGGVR